MKLHVVLISGKAGSGKSTLSSEIIKYITSGNFVGWDVREYIFAGPIYDMHNYCLGVLRNGTSVPPKDRDLLQFLGTDWGRAKYGPDIWVKVLRQQIELTAEKAAQEGWNRLVVTVPDTRFKNELDVYPGALKVRLECPEEVRRARCSVWGNANHPSETDLDDSIDKFDFVFDTSLVSAEQIARRVVSELK